MHAGIFFFKKAGEGENKLSQKKNGAKLNATLFYACVPVCNYTALTTLRSNYNHPLW